MTCSELSNHNRGSLYAVEFNCISFVGNFSWQMFNLDMIELNKTQFNSYEYLKGINSNTNLTHFRLRIIFLIVRQYQYVIRFRMIYDVIIYKLPDCFNVFVLLMIINLTPDNTLIIKCPNGKGLVKWNATAPNNRTWFRESYKAINGFVNLKMRDNGTVYVNQIRSTDYKCLL